MRYHSASPGNLYAALMIRSVDHSIAFHVDGTPEVPNYESASREGIWCLPNVSTSDYLVLANYGKPSMSIELSLFDATPNEPGKNNILRGGIHYQLPVGQ